MVSYFINSLFAPKKASKSKYNVKPVRTTMVLPIHIYQVELPSGEKAHYILEAHPNRFNASFCKKCDKFLNSEVKVSHFSENNSNSCVRKTDHQLYSPAYQVNSREKKSPSDILENKLILIYPNLNDRNKHRYVNSANLKMEYLRSENIVVNLDLDQVREISSDGTLSPVTAYQCEQFIRDEYTSI